MDDLMARLRARAADPQRRTDVRPTSFAQGVRSLDVGGLIAGLNRVQADLDRAVAASRDGRTDPLAHDRAEEIAASMSAVSATQLPPPAGAAEIAAAEARLGVPLPPFLRRAYAEVADGGFGPGEGLMPLTAVASRYAELRTGVELPRAARWPDGILPLVHRDPGYDCVEAATGRIVAWDPEGLSERSTRARFERSFGEVATSVEAWLAAWVDEQTFEERMADQMAVARIKAAREARARIAAKTPEERAAMGLPEVGWERVVWGGLGLEETDPR